MTWSEILGGILGAETLMRLFIGSSGCEALSRDTVEKKVEWAHGGQPFSLSLLTFTRTESCFFIGALQPRKWSRAAACISTDTLCVRNVGAGGISRFLPRCTQAEMACKSRNRRYKNTSGGSRTRRGRRACVHLSLKAPSSCSEEQTLSVRLVI